MTEDLQQAIRRRFIPWAVCLELLGILAFCPVLRAQVDTGAVEWITRCARLDPPAIALLRPLPMPNHVSSGLASHDPAWLAPRIAPSGTMP